MPERPQVRTAACAVASGSTLATARVLAASYLEHHPEHRFTVLVLDDADPAPWSDLDRCRVVGPRFLAIDEDEYLALATAYDEEGLAAAVTPLLLRSLLAEHDAVVYLDARTLVCAPFPEVAALAAAHGAVLTPRTLAPTEPDGLEPDELAAELGAVNPGFVAVGPGAASFLDWWTARAAFEQAKPVRGRPRAHQRSLDAAPALFGHLVLRDPGFGVGYWNLHERDIVVGADKVAVDGAAVRFVHFAEYRPDRPWLLAAHVKRPRVLLSERRAVKELCDRYAALLRANGEDDGRPYGFGVLDNGEPVLRSMRGLFLDEWTRFRKHALVPGPFTTKAPGLPPHAFTGSDEFRRWLGAPETPAAAAGGLPRLASWVWAGRDDLRTAFPEPGATSSAAFRQWCLTHGVAEGVVPAWAAPSGPVRPNPPTDAFGVNVVGYLTAELGLGEMGRLVLKAIEAAGVPVSSVVEESSLNGAVRTGLDRPGSVATPQFPVSVLAVNSDHTRILLDNHPEAGHDRYVIGLWAWELAEFPPSQHGGFPLVDEIWTLSDFCREAIAAHSPVPVHTVPLPVTDPGPVDRAPRRPGEPVRFLFAFDFNSTGQRKNPWGVVTAFQEAFPGRSDVHLVIKATNSHLHSAAAERLRHAIDGDDRIELMERYLSVEELDGLYNGCHGYVSLHRSEGLGLTVAEAMVRGMAVVATDYSGTKEFLDESVGWPVPHGMAAVGEGWAPYPPEGRWAEPDLVVAAAAMRRIADDPEEAERRGRAAREHVLRTRSLDRAAEWTRDRVTAAYRTWQSGARSAGTLAEATEDGPLARVRQSLLATPNPNAPSRMPFAAAMRRTVVRALAHYDGHLHTKLNALIDGVRDAVHSVSDRVDQNALHQQQRISAAEDTAARRYRELAARLDRLERGQSSADSP